MVLEKTAKVKLIGRSSRKRILAAYALLVVLGVLMLNLKGMQLEMANIKELQLDTKTFGSQTHVDNVTDDGHYKSQTNRTVPNDTAPSNITNANDGCGIVSNQYSSEWVPLTESENEEVQKLQECLQRTVPGTWPGASGYHNVHPRAFRGQLNCSVPISFNVVRSTLSQYKTVWVHGDSIMAQTFYTLACMMNSSIAEWNGTRIGQIVKKTGLGYGGPEQFTYMHSLGSTRFIYSRFGHTWGLDKNLYEDDFPLAVRTLTSRDAIVTNGAAVHNHAGYASKFERDVHLIAEQSKMTNATLFFFEPTPEEWPTSNGMFIPGRWMCKCYPLTEAQLLGIENNYTCGVLNKNSRREPDFDFFNRMYHPDTDTFFGGTNGTDSDDCIPNCAPNYWRTDVVRRGINETLYNNIHIVPIYWQLVSRSGGSSKDDGDCTHRDMYATVAMLFQWTRTIVGLQQDD